MLRHSPLKHHRTLHVDGAIMEFSLTNEGTKVSSHIFNTLFDLHESSWVTMVISRTGPSAAKEMSLLPSRPAFQRRMLPQVSTKSPTRDDALLLLPQRVHTHFQEITLSTHHWLPSHLDLQTHILSR